MSTTPGTVTPRDTDPDITRPAPDRRPPASAWALLRPLVLRLHFYAGVLVAPFLTVAALTGIVYVFSPQLSDLVYSDELLVGPRYGAPRPLDQQVAVAVLVATALGLLSLIFCGYRMWWQRRSTRAPSGSPRPSGAARCATWRSRRRSRSSWSPMSTPQPYGPPLRRAVPSLLDARVRRWRPSASCGR